LAEIESRSAIADDHAHVAACRAQTGAKTAWLRLSRSILIVHDDDAMFTSEAVTRGVRVHAQSEYAAERSQPSQNQWFFLYTITISNEGPETVQLLTRHWIITDGTGHIEEVRGPGVIGKQPVLSPGESTGC